MTPAKASKIRAERFEGKRLSRKEIRIQKEALKQAEAARWTIERLWNEYISQKALKGLAQDLSRFEKYNQAAVGVQRTQGDPAIRG